MNQTELNKLLFHLPNINSNLLPTLITNYEKLSDNPFGYFEKFKDLLNLKLDPMSIREFIPTIEQNFEIKKWTDINQYKEFLKPIPRFHLAILDQDKVATNIQIEFWFNRIMDKLKWSYSKENKSKNNLDLDEFLLQDISDLRDNITRLLLHFLQIQIITVIQDENRFFSEIIQLHEMSLLSFYMERFQSKKSKLQLQKYMTRLIFSRIPKNFSILEIYGFINYFENIDEEFETDIIIKIIQILESLKLPLHKKTPAIHNMIHLLGRIDQFQLKDQAWNYPRLRLRKLFLPEFIRVSSQQEIREYWENHSSKSSKGSLLKELVGNTTDPYFLSILLRKWPEKNHDILFAVNHLLIENEGEMVEFLLKLPDIYHFEKLNHLLNGHYYYRGQSLYLLHNILRKLENEDSVSKIKAKYRIAGILIC